LGYALFFGVPGPYRFDLGLQPAAAGPFNDRLEYFFYYGPTPKETLSEHLIVTGNINPISPRYVDGSGRLPPYGFELAATSLDELVRLLHHASLSAMLVPVVNAGRFDTPLNLFWPVVHGKPMPERARWLPYFYTYLKESHDRGIPMFRPLAFQYPENAAFWKQAGAFMIGDELLFSIEPKLTLPRGIWTNFCTGERFQGRKTIDTPQGACPLVHNGTIIPLAAAKDLVELHYFPRLGAEFFIAEPGFDMPTQVHASPAGEYLRLEAESLVTREFEWVVHQVSKPVKIEPAIPFQYDAAKRTLRVRVKARADSDIIVNINLEEPL
jgi:hypothetical protein